MSQKNHWEKVYSRKLNEKLGWYKLHLQTSLTWIKRLNLGADAPIIDVGGGVSTLTDDLLDANYRSITVLDISEKALSSNKARLGKKAEFMLQEINREINTVASKSHNIRISKIVIDFKNIKASLY